MARHASWRYWAFSVARPILQVVLPLGDKHLLDVAHMKPRGEQSIPPSRSTTGRGGGGKGQ
jgi:hypothetical protein